MKMEQSFTRGAGTSLHRQVFLVLRDEISRGEYSRVGALPKEEALCERFDVSRATVRRALENLASLGLVERRHGLGTFVRGGLGLLRSGPSLSFVDSLRKTVNETNVKVLHVGQEIPSPQVGTLLHLEEGAKAKHAIRLRSIDQTPVMITDAWIPRDVGKDVTVTSLRTRALYEMLLSQGIRFGRVIQEISAQGADPIRAGQLEIEVGSPMLTIVRLLHDVDDRPLLHITTYLTPERSRIFMDIPGETVDTLSAGQVVHEVSRRRPLR